MPATSLNEFLHSILLPEQHIAVSNFAMNGTISTAKAAASSTATKATTRRRTTRKTSAGAGTLLAYMQQHPTASYTAAQIAEASPFKTWRKNILGRTLNALTAQGKLTKTGDRWALANVIPNKALESRRSKRAGPPTPRSTEQRAATG